MAEKRLSDEVSLIKRGESVAWLKVKGSVVHVVVSGDGSHKAALAHVLDQMKK
jgi:hypothetical protein